jgi:uncharacterized HAD superfamily protein
MKNTVAFDLDGVLAHTDIILREAILGRYLIDIYPINKYAITIPGLTEEEFRQFVKDTLSRCSEDILPYNDTIPTLEKVYQATKEPIIIITARHRILSYETHAWCQKWLTVPYKLFMCPSLEKRILMLYLGVKNYIDDHPLIAEDVNYNSSIKCYLMNKTYNQDCKLPDESYRVSNLGEFYMKAF